MEATKPTSGESLFLFLVGVAAPLLAVLTGNTSWPYIAWLIVGFVACTVWSARSTISR